MLKIHTNRLNEVKLFISPQGSFHLCIYITMQKQALNLKITLQLGNGGFKVSLVLNVESGTHQ